MRIRSRSLLGASVNTIVFVLGCAGLHGGDPSAAGGSGVTSGSGSSGAGGGAGAAGSPPTQDGSSPADASDPKTDAPDETNAPGDAVIQDAATERSQVDTSGATDSHGDRDASCGVGEGFDLSDPTHQVATDRRTCLTWMRRESERFVDDRAAAVSYCENLELAGHSDWRLPSLAEYMSLIDCRKDPRWDTSAFLYFTEEQTSEDLGAGWACFFDTAQRTIGLEVSGRSTWARCVRGRAENLPAALPCVRNVSTPICPGDR